MPRLAAALALVLVASSLALPRPAAAATDYPSGYRGFHTHAEMVAAVQAIAAAHPSIVRTFSIGDSAQGRELLAAKVSDNVATDEAEPEAYIDGLTHGNEPMSVEMTIRTLRWLAEGYGSDSRITGIVNRTEVWIVFAVNPDGQAYDYGSGRLRNWRKNRQPNAGTTAIGTDLNRNYGYRWGGSGSSASPGSSKYRGAAPFSAPETRAVRDFVRSRVIGGRQQIRVAVSFHEFGRYVMWPYAATRSDLPKDMTSQDRAALVTIGKAMATRNGYRPMQASDLYVASGTTADWLFGTYRLAAFTVELSARRLSEGHRHRVRDGPQQGRGPVPAGAGVVPVGGGERGRAPGPLRRVRRRPRGRPRLDGGPRRHGHRAGVRTLGARQPVGDARLGRDAPADDDPLRRRGVRHRAPRRRSPVGIRPRRPDHDPLAADPAAGHDRAAPVLPLVPRPRGERVVGRSPARDRRAAGRRRRRSSGSGRGATVVAGAWTSASLSLDPWAGQAIRIRFEAVDAAGASTIEAGVDDVRVTRPPA